MKLSRLLQPLFFSFVLIFAQQAGSAHILSHAFDQVSKQQDKHTPHSPECEKCTIYFQLGSALNSGIFNFVAVQVENNAVAQLFSSFKSIHSLAAVARGPPLILQFFA